MRAEMRSLREHLAKTDAVKEQLAERLGHLDAENERLNAQVGTVEARVGEVATHVGSVEHEVVTVAGSIGPTVENAIRTAAEASPDDEDPMADLRSRLEEVSAALRTQQSQIADVALVATDAAERSEHTDSKIAELTDPDRNARLEGASADDRDEAKRQLAQLAEKVGALDSRVNQVSLELTNQLTELSSDIDRAATNGSSTDAELLDRINAQLDDVTGGQERLANEQARYAIQFRADLAELADRLKRNRS